MNRRRVGASMLLVVLMMAQLARAEPSAQVQEEVNFLLAYVEQSGCEFYRNGTWHDPKTARAHLRDKYQYLVARNQIKSTEEFIEKAATESSFTGRPYAARCNGGASEPSSQWLRRELTRFSSSH